MIKILNVSCLVAIYFSIASAQLAPTLLSWDGNTASIPTLPKTLLTTGFNKNDPTKFIPYSVNVPQWRNFLQSNRYIYLPAGQKVTPGDSLNYTYPVGTVLIRDIYVDTILGNPASRIFVETQFQIMTSTIGWAGLAYTYRDDQTDADVVTEDDFIEKKFTINLNGKNTDFKDPAGAVLAKVNVEFVRSAFDCPACHFSNANGFITQQLNNGTQINELVAKGVLTGPPPNLATLKVPRWYSWDHPTATPDQKFFSYLGANCSHCHIDLDERDSPGKVNSYQYFSSMPLEPLGGDNQAFIPGAQADSSFAIIRMLAMEMPQAEVSLPDLTVINKMLQFLKTDAVLQVQHVPVSASGFQATLLNNMLRLNRPGPVKFFDLEGRQIGLHRVDSRTYAVIKALDPGVYFAKQGNRICRVQHF